MAMVAKKMIVWHSMPTIDENGKLNLEEPNVTRVEIGIDSVVPDTIPVAVQREWEQQDLIYDDPSKTHLVASEGPPRMTMPLTQIQKVEAAKKATGAPVLGRTIPPRPSHT